MRERDLPHKHKQDNGRCHEGSSTGRRQHTKHGKDWTGGRRKEERERERGEERERERKRRERCNQTTISNSLVQLTDDDQDHAQYLYTRSDTHHQHRRVLWRSKDVSMHQLPASLLQWVVLHEVHAWHT